MSNKTHEEIMFFCCNILHLNFVQQKGVPMSSPDTNCWKLKKKLEADTRLRSETKDQGGCLLLTEYVLQRQSGYSCLTSVILVSDLCIQCWHPLIACRAGQLWKAQQKPDFVSSLRLNLTPASSLEYRAGCCRCWLRMYSGVNKSLLKNKLSSVFYKWISVEMASGLYLLICPYSYFQFSGWNVQLIFTS